MTITTPANSEGMLGHLRERTPGRQLDERTYTLARDLLISHYIPPAALAALFDALAKIPGLSVVPDVTAVDGRHGVSVSVFTPDLNGISKSPEAQHARRRYRHDLIFDPRTSEYLGNQTIDLDHDNTVQGGQTTLRTTVVDQPWQLP